MKLQDQRVLITGATAGIGQQAAKLFARRGAALVITGRDTVRGAQTVAAIEAEGGRAEFIAADLTDIESVRRLAEEAGEVDVLVNNAATVVARPTLEQDVESFDTIFDVDLIFREHFRDSGVVSSYTTASTSAGIISELHA